jgi:hypothetical protein
MKKTAEELNAIVNEFAQMIEEISEKDFSARPLPNKWSRKEVLGHLIDSAQNNLRRFICGQYEAIPPKITYDQDFWVAANGYHDMEKAEVIALWKSVNRRIAAVLKNMPAENYSRECDTSKTSVQLHSLQWLAEDYVKHMKHHLNQIIPGSFTLVYP